MNRGEESVKGLIPACAGKTLVDSALAELGGAHPRMRGENSFSSFFISTL